MDRPRLRVGMVGAGFVARLHAEAYRRFTTSTSSFAG